jgi:hypothetical protein
LRLIVASEAARHIIPFIAAHWPLYVHDSPCWQGSSALP